MIDDSLALDYLENHIDPSSIRMINPNASLVAMLQEMELTAELVKSHLRLLSEYAHAKEESQGVINQYIFVELAQRVHEIQKMASFCSEKAQEARFQERLIRESKECTCGSDSDSERGVSHE